MAVTRGARHRLRMWPRSRLLMLFVAAAAVLFLAGSVLWAQLGQQQAQDQTGVVEQQRDGAAAQAASLAEQIKAACRDGSLGGAVCQQAEDVAATPVPPVPGPAGPAGPPPTAEEVSAAVASYLQANPPPAGRAPTPAEVAAAVASYLTANPPSPGRPPTAGEIAAAVQTYYDANPPPPGEDGEPGVDGEPGRPPTAAEIQAAVDAYLARNPPPAGEDGEPGPPGPAGPPAASYTMTFSDGTTQTCSRTGGTETAPTYTCSAPVGAPDDEDDGLLGP